MEHGVKSKYKKINTKAKNSEPMGPMGRGHGRIRKAIVREAVLSAPAGALGSALTRLKEHSTSFRSRSARLRLA
jgi:hypothetical protein